MPSAISLRIRRSPVRRGAPSVRMAISAAITATNETAFTAKAVAVPQRAMASPASAGPITRAPLNTAEFSAIAETSDSLPTISATKAWRAGMSSVLARP